MTISRVFPQAARHAGGKNIRLGASSPVEGEAASFMLEPIYICMALRQLIRKGLCIAER